jgi:ABC-2 type transport system permease protein
VIAHIAKNELRCQLRDGRFVAAAGLILVVLVAALGSSAVSRAQASAERSHARAHARELWLNQAPTNPHSATHYGTYVFKPVTRLSAVDSGVDPYTGVVAHLESHVQREFAHRPVRDSAGLGRLGETGPGFLLCALLPLLAIFLAQGTVASERESGLLKQSLALGATPRAWLWGKFLGLFAAVALVATLALGTCLGGALCVPGEESLGEFAARSLALYGGILLLIGVTTALSVGAAARWRSPRTALAVLLSAWGAGTFLLPRGLNEVADALWKTPSAQALEEQAHKLYSQGLDGHDPNDQRAQRRIAEILAANGVASVEELPFDISGVLMQEGEEYQARAYATVFGQMWSHWRKQNRLRDLAGLIWPFAPARRVSMAVAGTDLEHHVDFARAAEAYRGILVKTMNTAIANNKRPDDEPYVAGREMWETVPDFAYARPGLGFALTQASGGLFMLLVWSLLGALALLLPWRTEART